MFIVAWEGGPPPDKAEWIQILREVLAGELGSYRVVFSKGARGLALRPGVAGGRAPLATRP